MIFFKTQSCFACDGSRLNRCSGFRVSLLPVLLFLFVSLLLASVSVKAVPLQVPMLSSDTRVASAGYYQLLWTSSVVSQTQFLLEESSNPDFIPAREIYRGPDRARVISGKSDGNYYYRISAISLDQHQVGNIVQVSVRHHSLHKALLFFLVGVLVFVATLLLIYLGNRRSRHHL